MSRAAANSRFNKKFLSMLIDKARGTRNLKAFAADCGISYLQLRKLYLGLQDNPPGKKLLTKLAGASENGITLEDYLFVCVSENSESSTDATAKLSVHDLAFIEKYFSLGSRQKKTLEDFLDFLLQG